MTAALDQALEQLRPVAGAGTPYQLDTPLIPWAYQGALLAEFARSRGLDEREDWQAVRGQPGALLSPRQLLAQLAVLQAQAKDSAFVLGQLSLPGHYGLASQALQQSANLLEALRWLTRLSARLSPLLTPRLLALESRGELLLYWTEACGCPPSLRPFLVDLQMAAVVSMAQWLGGEAMPWRFSFNRTAPRERAQHAVYLGKHLQFDCQLDAMRLPLALARQPWPARPTQGLKAARALEQGADPEAERRPWLGTMYEQLLPLAGASPSLADLAARFGCSPATLKRHLALHGSHYQAELDQVRTHLALYLLHCEGQDSEAVAQRLGFYDSTNFRRSFKRWTGLLPSALRAA